MDPYLKHRQDNTNVSGNAVVATADTATVTLATGKTGWTIFVQRIFVTIITSAAQTLTFKDTAGTPKQIEATDSAPGANTHYVWDFGPRGVPLTEAKNFIAAISGAGLAANIGFEAYMKQTGNEYLSNTATGQSFA